MGYDPEEEYKKSIGASVESPERALHDRFKKPDLNDMAQASYFEHPWHVVQDGGEPADMKYLRSFKDKNSADAHSTLMSEGNPKSNYRVVHTGDVWPKEKIQEMQDPFEYVDGDSDTIGMAEKSTMGKLIAMNEEFSELANRADECHQLSQQIESHGKDGSDMREIGDTFEHDLAGRFSDPDEYMRWREMRNQYMFGNDTHLNAHPTDGHLIIGPEGLGKSDSDGGSKENDWRPKLRASVNLMTVRQDHARQADDKYADKGYGDDDALRQDALRHEQNLRNTFDSHEKYKSWRGAYNVLHHGASDHPDAYGPLSDPETEWKSISGGNMEKRNMKPLDGSIKKTFQDLSDEEKAKIEQTMAREQEFGNRYHVFSVARAGTDVDSRDLQHHGSYDNYDQAYSQADAYHHPYADGTGRMVMIHLSDEASMKSLHGGNMEKVSSDRFPRRKISDYIKQGQGHAREADLAYGQGKPEVAMKHEQALRDMFLEPSAHEDYKDFRRAHNKSVYGSENHEKAYGPLEEAETGKSISGGNMEKGRKLSPDMFSSYDRQAMKRNAKAGNVHHVIEMSFQPGGILITRGSSHKDPNEAEETASILNNEHNPPRSSHFVVHHDDIFGAEKSLYGGNMEKCFMCEHDSVDMVKTEYGVACGMCYSKLL